MCYAADVPAVLKFFFATVALEISSYSPARNCGRGYIQLVLHITLLGKVLRRVECVRSGRQLVKFGCLVIFILEK